MCGRRDIEQSSTVMLQPGRLQIGKKRKTRTKSKTPGALIYNVPGSRSGGIRYRSLNRRCSRLERARRSFRANKLGSLAFGTPHWGNASLLCRGGRGLSNPTATRSHKKRTPVKGVRFLWSKWRDSNPRPFGPEPNALPNCATPRYVEPMRGLEPLTC